MNVKVKMEVNIYSMFNGWFIFNGCLMDVMSTYKLINVNVHGPMDVNVNACLVISTSNA